MKRMFAHFRDDMARDNASGQIRFEDSVLGDGKVRFFWKDIRNPDIRADKIWYYKIFNAAGQIGTVELYETEYTFTR